MKRNALTLSTLVLLVAVTILSACGKEEKAPTPSELMKTLPTSGSLPGSGNSGGDFNSDPNFNLPSVPGFSMPSMPSLPSLRTPSMPSFNKFPSGGPSLPSLPKGGVGLETAPVSDDRSALLGNVTVPGFTADPKNAGPGGKWAMEEKKTTHTEINEITFAPNYVALKTTCVFKYDRIIVEVATPVLYANGSFAIAKTARKQLTQYGETCKSALDKGVYAYEIDGAKMAVLASGEKHPAVLSKQ